MTDIPLKLIGRTTRSKEGYTQLQDGETDDPASDSKGLGRVNGGVIGEMRSTRAYKGKSPARIRNTKYKDEPEEEEGLLNEHERVSVEEASEFQQSIPVSRAVSATTLSIIRKLNMYLVECRLEDE